jgi:hypothetical protein
VNLRHGGAPQRDGLGNSSLIRREPIKELNFRYLMSGRWVKVLEQMEGYILNSISILLERFTLCRIKIGKREKNTGGFVLKIQFN